MIKILLFAAIFFANCSSSKKDSKTTVKNVVSDSTQSIATAPAKTEEEDIEKLPKCITRLIGRFKKAEVQNPPRSIYRYTYHGRTVYYIPPVCCDNFSDLIDSNCRSMGHPDGGFTGRGDGNNPDFRRDRTNDLAR